MDPESLQIKLRPVIMDLEGVTGFVVLENSSTPHTKTSINAEQKATHLYSIDDKGNITLTLFYFEASSENTTDSLQINIQKEVSNALQVVPSLVTDLGNYIVFSGCSYQISDADMSDLARTTCLEFINEQGTRSDITYMIRKSDGALFDLTDQDLFIYSKSDSDYLAGTGHWSPYYYISPKSYIISAKNNLFVRSTTAVHKIEDNGNAVDFRKVTQDLPFRTFELFGIDESENLYFSNPSEHMDTKLQIHIYKSNGLFDLLDPKADHVFDMITDKGGFIYLFYVPDSIKGFQCARLKDCSLEIMSTMEIKQSGSLNSKFRYFRCSYLGYNDNCFLWSDYEHLLSYNNNLHQFELRDLSEDVKAVLDAEYDVIAYGPKTYCANTEGNSVKVIEVDLALESCREYLLEVDMTSILPTNYNVRIMGNHPYMIIDGKNPNNGVDASLTINLVTGENNSSFAADNRNVVSFFRIN